MKIVLIYPPPWKIAAKGHPPYPPGEGPPGGVDTAAVDTGDFIQAPYGLLSLAAQVLHAEDRVRVFNLANIPWPSIEELIAHLDADLFGLSCLTGNRRGAAMLAALIRTHHPQIPIVAGGPHVSALPLETLQHVPAIDIVVIGEGEQTFAEICKRCKAGAPLKSIPGAAWREGGRCRLGPPRRLIEDLDTLVSPLASFDLGTVMTSRGCPMHCTFCSSTRMWGHRPRFHSVPYVLQELETAVRGHGRRMLSIKDDTFTANRERTLAICEGIRRHNLDVIWSCDTRVDCLDDALLRTMRQAGCVRISLGVESGSPAVLKNIRKRISPDMVLASTRAAQKVGLQVRYYMMVGNRGETLDTFQQSLQLIEDGRPNQFVFSQLHLYPGTEEFEIFRQQGMVSTEIFFQRDFLCLSCFAGSAADERTIREQLQRMQGVRTFRHYEVEERRQILERMPDLHLSHMDLARAWVRRGSAAAAEENLQQALNRGYFLPGRVYNLLACICALRNDIEGATANLERAAAIYPHRVVRDNQARLDSWLVGGGRHSGVTLELDPGDGWESTCVGGHPEYPDPSSLHLQDDPEVRPVAATVE